MSVEALIALLEMLVAEVPEADLLSELESLRAADAGDAQWFDQLSRVVLNLSRVPRRRPASRGGSDRARRYGDGPGRAP